MGAGHNVTAFFEIVPKGGAVDDGGELLDLKYQKPPQLERAPKGELLTVSLRYKQPDGARSVLLQVPCMNSKTAFDDATADFRFAASVAAFGMLLRESPHRGSATIEEVIGIASATTGKDAARKEFVGLARKAATKLEK
jgi:Ca-activated chloride channel family protein